MSALTVKGTVISIDNFTHDTKKGKDGQPFQISTHYVVNGGGAPVAVKNMGPALWKAGDKIDVPVRASVFRNEVNLMVEG